MENQDELAIIIGENIMRLRKMTGMTQLELAEKLNYSDKSVSKWEQGNGIPDVRILLQLAGIFGVTVDDLVTKHEKTVVMPKKTRRFQRVITLTCATGLCWLAAVVFFVFFGLFFPELDGWLAFLYAVPASAIVILVFACVWGWKTVRILSISALIWSLLAVIYVTALVFGYNVWLVFLIGVPLQILALFYFVWRKGANYRVEK